MKLSSVILLFLFICTSFSQNNDFRLKNNYGLKLNDFNYPSYKIKSFTDSVTKQESVPVKKSHKSPGLAFIYSLIIPGLGHVYADRFVTGKYFMISEAAIWLTYAAFSVYGNWLLDDAYGFSTTHAGVDISGKARDDKFFTDIANYNNVYDYNDDMLRQGSYDKLYDPQAGYYFYWDNETNRKNYKEDKLAGDKTLNDRLFVVGAAVVNHIMSAISAVFAANSYNNEISRKSSGGFSFKAGVQRHFNRIDGISLKMVKFF
jgi:TM2 domain-containing membrane protein YozV